MGTDDSAKYLEKIPYKCVFVSSSMKLADNPASQLSESGDGWVSKRDAVDSEVILDAGPGMRIRKIAVTPNPQYLRKIANSGDRMVNDFTNVQRIYCDTEQRWEDFNFQRKTSFGWILLRIDHAADHVVSNEEKRVGLKTVLIYGYQINGEPLPKEPVKPPRPSTAERAASRAERSPVISAAIISGTPRSP
ncbi:unnamed protein product, partial [Mesorhabditis belari]|uniref:Uncharacterized protein n=1 Tax=Mesorhabditis belari TaxID=2138241 RepID=A0AAF3EBE8_9BILA